MKDVQVYATVTQGQYNWGRNIVTELIALNNGEEVPENVDTGYVVVDSTNVAEKYPD